METTESQVAIENNEESSQTNIHYLRSKQQQQQQQINKTNANGTSPIQTFTNSSTIKSSHPLANNININNVPNSSFDLLTPSQIVNLPINKNNQLLYTMSGPSPSGETGPQVPHIFITSPKSSPKVSPNDVISYQRIKKVIFEQTGIDGEIEARENYLNHLKSIDLTKYSFPNE